MTRFDADLYRAAAEAGERESRSTQQQLAHWARLGKAISDRSTAAGRRVAAALEGTLPTRILTPEEGAAFNAEADARIADLMAEVNLAETVTREGVTAVVVDENGELVTYQADGTTLPLKNTN